MKKPIQIFCDFDGTVTKGDTIDFLLEKLALPEWEAIEARWVKGEIGSRECMSKQVALIQGGWQGVLSVLKAVEVDNSFAPFVNWCRMRQIPVTIVSDGLDRVINHLLIREGIRVDRVIANHLVDTPAGGLALEFPHNSHKVVCASGQCKCQVLDQAGQHPYKVVIGDGRSDFCWAANADFLFAKDKLRLHCMSNNIYHYAFNNFVQIRYALEEMMAEQPQPLMASHGHFAETPVWAQT